MTVACLKYENKKSAIVKNFLLVVLVIALAVAPLFIKRDAEFSGADALAEKAITKINAGYKPWFSPLWEPPSSEIETFLFALQAAVGAGFIGYYIGYVRGRKKRNSEDIS